MCRSWFEWLNPQKGGDKVLDGDLWRSELLLLEAPSRQKKEAYFALLRTRLVEKEESHRAVAMSYRNCNIALSAFHLLVTLSSPFCAYMKGPTWLQILLGLFTTVVAAVDKVLAWQSRADAHSKAGKIYQTALAEYDSQLMHRVYMTSCQDFAQAKDSWLVIDQAFQPLMDMLAKLVASVPCLPAWAPKQTGSASWQKSNGTASWQTQRGRVILPSVSSRPYQERAPQTVQHLRDFDSPPLSSRPPQFNEWATVSYDTSPPHRIDPPAILFGSQPPPQSSAMQHTDTLPVAEGRPLALAEPLSTFGPDDGRRHHGQGSETTKPKELAMQHCGNKGTMQVPQRKRNDHASAIVPALV